MKKIFFAVICLLMHVSVFAQLPKGLPLYNSTNIKANGDWLVDRIPNTTNFYKTNKGYLVMSNGLVSRMFDITKGGATLGIENLMTGENMLRTIKPEAELLINGFKIQAGGLLGQPIQNYLSEAWMQQLLPNPGALHLTTISTGPTEARFGWKRRTAWMSKDLPWPAPGKKITFTYQANKNLIDYFLAGSKNDDNRKILFADEFKSLGDHWKLFSSNADKRSSFINEGKPGEIWSNSNHAVGAEMLSPANTKVWITQLDAGTDNASVWGPGMALVTAQNKVYKINLRPADLTFGIFDGNRERTKGILAEGKKVFLRAEQLTSSLSFSYSYNGKDFTMLDEINIQGEHIVKLRVGKLDAAGEFTDGNIPGNPVRSHVYAVKMLGDHLNSNTETYKRSLSFLHNLKVLVHYEMYDGIPLMGKWIQVINNNKDSLMLESFKSEILGFVEAESSVDEVRVGRKPNITIQTDYQFGGMSNDNLENCSIAWLPDSTYKTQVNYGLKTQVNLEVSPKWGPMRMLGEGDTLTSFRTWELLNDSYDRERKGLAERRMFRILAPWVTENPMMMHVRNADNNAVKKAIDQCAEVGFEMVILTFGSGFNIEDRTTANLDRMKMLSDYAHNKGIALGGYSLLASRSVNPQTNVVMPSGMLPRFGNSPCLQSRWGQDYFETLYRYFKETGQDILEHDGSYPGDVCASHDHPGHKELHDSQWNQYEKITWFYQWCREQGIFLNVPDNYFLQGSNKTGMGYRETNWSLPREQQEIIERQNIYDGTWTKTPSMGWMFVPLVEYQGGGKAATIEPLHEHLTHSEQRLANLFGSGVQACYRGPQLFDGPQTKAVVKKWVNFYKQNRRLLDADVIHVRRPDGQDYDGLLHVDAQGKTKGLLMLYNPLSGPIQKQIEVNLYYSGLKNKTTVTDNLGRKQKLLLNRNYTIQLPINIPAKGQQWFFFE